MRLTDLKIKKLSPPNSGQKTVFDDALKGFGIRVSQGGTKSFVVLLGRNRRRKTIGKYPEVSLSIARAEAKRLQSEHSMLSGGSVALLRSIPFTVARDEFLNSAEQRNKASTVREYRRLLTKNFTFDSKLQEVTRRDITAIVESLQSRPSEAHHVFVAIRTMMNWCVKQGWIDSSPVPALSFSTKARDRVLNEDELKLIWRRAESVGYPYGTIVQLLIVTGQRRGEIAGLRRSWIGDAEVNFPQGFTKNKREHRVPLSEIAIGILDTIPSTDNDLLFPSKANHEVPVSGWSKFKVAFDYADGGERPLVYGYTLHDLRRTFSSNLARMNTPIHVTEKLLNHVSGTLSGVAAIYNRYSYFDEMCDAVAKHDGFLRELIRS